jgi:hypothetical protein
VNAPAGRERWVGSIKRGLAGLLMFGGGLRFVQWLDGGVGPEGALTSLLLIAVGIGVVRNWRWARWLAMGACFLAIVGAFLAPVLLYTWQRFPGVEDQSRHVLMFSAFAATFGYLGYKGLEYFRSELAHQDYAGDAFARSLLREEGSKAVVYSAMTWVVVWIILGSIHVRAQDPGSALTMHRPAKTIERESASPRSGAARAARELPDLVITRLCLNDDAQVMADVENRGDGSSPRGYQISYTDPRFRGSQERPVSLVLEPGQHVLVLLDRATRLRGVAEMHLPVDVAVDRINQIRESDEANNTLRFVIEFRGTAPVNLPSCSS